MRLRLKYFLRQFYVFEYLLLLVNEEFRLPVQMLLEHLIDVGIERLQEILHVLHHRRRIELLQTVLVQLLLDAEDLLLDEAEFLLDFFYYGFCLVDDFV